MAAHSGVLGLENLWDTESPGLSPRATKADHVLSDQQYTQDQDTPVKCTLANPEYTGGLLVCRKRGEEL